MERITLYGCGGNHMELKELEKKYEELGKEIEKLKLRKERKVGFEDDPVFLLSIEEYKKYENNIPIVKNWWWLRSPGIYQYCAAGVYGDGSVSYNGSIVHNDDDAVRPALRISNLKSSNLKFVKDDYLIYCGTTWLKIDDGLYIIENDIGCHSFDANSNDYESSEIRKFLLDWYEERKNW